MELMKILTVYERPDDYPHSYVARYFIIEKGKVIPTDEIFIAQSFEKLLQLVPKNLFFIPRLEDDAPSVIGVWI